MKPMMIPAESALKVGTSIPSRPLRTTGVKNVSAKYPKTIVGTPASSSMNGFAIRRVRGLAYSAR